MQNRNKILLSICVPTYKKADWLELSLKILLKQTRPFAGKVEIVVSDDASPDHSAKVLKNLSNGNEDLFRFFVQEKNLKNNKNYLFAIDQAQGDYIWLLGNDDYLREGAIEKVIQTLEDHRDIDFFYMSYSFFNPPSHPDEILDLLQKPIQKNDLPPSSFGEHVMEDRALEWIGEVPAYDALCFTPMYGAIVKKSIWRAAFEFNANGEFFKYLQGSFGYAEYLATHFLSIRGYYIGYPYVMASRDISWGSFAASACLRNMPVLYDILEEQGVPLKVLRFIRDDYLKLIRDSIPYVLQYRNIFHHEEFSFWDHTKRFWSYPQYWKNLLTILPKQLSYMCTKGFWVPLLQKYCPAFIYKILKIVNTCFHETESPFQKVLGVNFYRKSCADLIKNLPKSGLIAAPAAPALLNLVNDIQYQKALHAADINLVDSGLMALCWNFTHPKQKISRTSGYRFLKSLIETNYLHGENKTFWLMANERDRDLSMKWLNLEEMPESTRCGERLHENFNLKKESFYICPHYHSHALEDPVLLQILDQKRPPFIIINIGGGTQERLGHYLKINLQYKPLIICTGAALGFLSGHQTPIPLWADKLYLGWLWRCFGNPKTFIPRYIKGLKFIPLFLKFHDKSPCDAHE